MGASYVSLGMTVEQGASLDAERAKEVVLRHLDTIEGKLSDIDPSGRYELLGPDAEIDTDDAGEVESRDEEREELVKLLVDGLVWIHEDWGSDSWHIPGAENLAFVTAGGMSHGDSPFDEFDGAVMASEAAAIIPEFGREVGILGGGIRLAYGEGVE